MTLDEWISCEKPRQMLEFLLGTTVFRRRKLRLFAIACTREGWQTSLEIRDSPILPAAFLWSESVLSVLEDDADGVTSLSASDIENIRDEALRLHDTENRYRSSSFDTFSCCTRDGFSAAFDVTCSPSPLSAVRQCQILREIVGDPVAAITLPDGPMRLSCGDCDRPIPRVIPGGTMICVCGGIIRTGLGSPSWQTPDVADLAKAAYREREKDGTLDRFRLSLLADALEEAGCATGEHGRTVITHLRASHVHYRGCWALDLCKGDCRDQDGR